MVFLKLKINYLQKSSTGVFDQCKFTVSDNYCGKLLGAFLYILCAILFDPSMLESVMIQVKPASRDVHASRREVPRVSQSRPIAFVLSLTMDDL